MSWWLSNIPRAKQERLAIQELAEQVGWLSSVNWRVIPNLQLAVDFDITHRGESFALTMTYSSMFPDTPPIVKPRDQRRLSGHQYGVGGELCLEHRPDNWNAAVTGAAMIQSAYALISGERSVDGESAVVASAHQASLGRDVRGEQMRFIVPHEALGALAAAAVETPLPFEGWDRVVNPTWVASLTAIGPVDARLWTSAEPRPAHATATSGFVFRATELVSPLQSDTAAFVAALLNQFPQLANCVSENFSGFILLGTNESWMALNLFPSKGSRGAFLYKTLAAPPTEGRLPDSYAALASKRVAVVGCGSVGSKIATTLARAGVRNFVFVDEDVFFSANLVRNDLDAKALGLHKVDALAVRIKEIAGGATVSCRRIALGQQESATATESVVEELGTCDLLVDATADPRAFNLVGAVSRRQRKPMVWSTVFAGGIGGVIARVRPDIEPTPPRARDQVQAWCDAHGVAWRAGSGTDYGAEMADGQTLIADDSAVTVIAAHTASVILDTLLREDTGFPAPAYAVGLSRNWIFSAPFDTWPIEMQADGTWGNDSEPSTGEEVRAFVKELFPGADAP